MVLTAKQILYTFFFFLDFLAGLVHRHWVTSSHLISFPAPSVLRIVMVFLLCVFRTFSFFVDTLCLSIFLKVARTWMGLYLITHISSYPSQSNTHPTCLVVVSLAFTHPFVLLLGNHPVLGNRHILIRKGYFHSLLWLDTSTFTA